MTSRIEWDYLMRNMPPCPCCLREIIHSQIHRMKESNNELLTAHSIQLGWVECQYQNRKRLMMPLKIMKLKRISKMKSREIEYIDRISFELSQIRNNLKELSAIIDMVDEKCNAGGSVINDYFDMQTSLNSLIDKINKSTEEERNILEKLKKKGI
jgi:lauroyl/myristoyl acyltransferase